MKKPKEKIAKSMDTLYQRIARKFETDPVYVGQINRGDRKPIRGKGLKIKKELEKYNQKN